MPLPQTAHKSLHPLVRQAIAAIAGCIAALLGTGLWAPYGNNPFLLFAIGWGLINVGYLMKYWIDGWRGLDQWPEPHGRYYRRWLALCVSITSTPAKSAG